MRLDELDKKITSSDLEALETFADRIFGKVGIDVEFTRHFLDRVNDERNGEQITGSELTRLFKQEYKRWGKPIAQMGPDAEAVMKDLATDINMPFALRWDRDNNELDLIVKTVMRKKDFKTSNREFEVESANESEEDCPACNGTGWERVDSDEDERGCDECSGTGKIEESGYRMNGPSGLRHTPTIRSMTSPSSFLPKAGKKVGWIKRMFSDEFSEEKLKEESSIHKFNKEDPNNPEVMIQGYGSLMLNQIEASVVRKLAELTKMAERGDFEQIQSLLDKDVMQTMMKAIVDTKAELQATRKRGGSKSRGINRESILDVIGRSEIEELDEESPWELLMRKVDPKIHHNRYQKAAERLHSVLKRKETENKGKWRHALGWYVSKIADGFKGIDSSTLQDYYLKNFDAVFEEVNETGGVGKIVPGVNTTIDVGPDEIKKQAKKFGNAVDKDGLPKNTFR